MIAAPKDEHILSIENRLNLLMNRLSELERRLSALEKGTAVQKPDVQTPRPSAKNIEHNYLRRAINTARRDYERKSG
ncbi:MAG TPA: hypothetical protein EYP46_03260 [Hadesarchaea archaeon]|nr:hypothetical protein [Hadesarchaea archaeon]